MEGAGLDFDIEARSHSNHSKLKLLSARSRLYRRRFFLPNTRWKALDDIYKFQNFYELFHNVFFFWQRGRTGHILSKDLTRKRKRTAWPDEYEGLEKRSDFSVFFFFSRASDVRSDKKTRKGRTVWMRTFSTPPWVLEVPYHRSVIPQCNEIERQPTSRTFYVSSERTGPRRKSTRKK